MGDFRELLAKNIATLDVPELFHSIGEYSYVLKAKDISALRSGENLVAQFGLGDGNWVVAAKSTMRAPGGDGICDVQWRLTATEGPVAHSDRSKASAPGLSYASAALLLGVRFVKSGVVDLVVSAQGVHHDAEILDTVITALRIDKLFVWDL
jgi:hypothetical protein